MRKIATFSAALCAAMLAPHASAENTDQDVEQQLQELKTLRQNLEQQSQQFDQRIQQLENGIGRARWLASGVQVIDADQPATAALPDVQEAGQCGQQ